MCSVESLALGLVIRAFRLKGRGGVFCGLGPQMSNRSEVPQEECELSLERYQGSQEDKHENLETPKP